MLSLLVGVPLLFSCQIEKEDGLGGVWLVKSASLNGEPIKRYAREKFVFIFGDDKVITRRTGEPDRLGKYSIGPGGQAKHIDITPLGEDEETSMRGLGIFKVEDNCLILAMGSKRINGKDIRPTDFDGQKETVLFRLERIKPDLAQKIQAPKKSAEKTPPLEGRWELITEEKSNESVELEFVRSLFGGEQNVLVRRKVKGSFLGLSSVSTTTTPLPWVKAPEGRKSAFGLIEKIDDKKEATIRLIRYHFRGEILELLGEASPEGAGTIHLTGEWRRAAKKTK